MKHTVYEGYDSNEKVIQWFWQCVRSWPSERQLRLLQFATGSPRLPVKGFQELKGPFTIAKLGYLSEFPESNTGFNRVILPSYKDDSNLEQELVLVTEYANSIYFLQDTQQLFTVDYKGFFYPSAL